MAVNVVPSIRQRMTDREAAEYDQGRNSLVSGLYSTRGLLRGGFGAGARMLGADEVAQVLEDQAAADTARAAETLPYAPGFTKTRSLRDFGRNISNLAGTQAPILALSMLSGGAGIAGQAGIRGLTGAAARTAMTNAARREAARGLGGTVLDATAKQIAKEEAKRKIIGSGAGVMTSFTPLMTGENYNQMMADPVIRANYTPAEIAARSAALAVPQSAAELVPFRRVAGALFKPGAKGLREATQEGLKSAFEEGIVEAGQGATTDMLQQSMNPAAETGGLEQRAEEFLSGALMGGPLTFAGTLAGNVTKERGEPTDDEKLFYDLYQEERDKLLLQQGRELLGETSPRVMESFEDEFTPQDVERSSGGFTSGENIASGDISKYVPPNAPKDLLDLFSSAFPNDEEQAELGTLENELDALDRRKRELYRQRRADFEEWLSEKHEILIDDLYEELDERDFELAWNDYEFETGTDAGQNPIFNALDETRDEIKRLADRKDELSYQAYKRQANTFLEKYAPQEGDSADVKRIKEELGRIYQKLLPNIAAGLENQANTIADENDPWEVSLEQAEAATPVIQDLRRRSEDITNALIASEMGTFDPTKWGDRYFREEFLKEKTLDDFQAGILRGAAEAYENDLKQAQENQQQELFEADFDEGLAWQKEEYQRQISKLISEQAVLAAQGKGETEEMQLKAAQISFLRSEIGKINAEGRAQIQKSQAERRKKAKEDELGRPVTSVPIDAIQKTEEEQTAERVLEKFGYVELKEYMPEDLIPAQVDEARTEEAEIDEGEGQNQVDEYEANTTIADRETFNGVVQKKDKVLHLSEGALKREAKKMGYTVDTEEGGKGALTIMTLTARARELAAKARRNPDEVIKEMVEREVAAQSNVAKSRQPAGAKDGSWQKMLERGEHAALGEKFFIGMTEKDISINKPDDVEVTMEQLRGEPSKEEMDHYQELLAEDKARAATYWKTISTPVLMNATEDLPASAQGNAERAKTLRQKIEAGSFQMPLRLYFRGKLPGGTKEILISLNTQQLMGIMARQMGEFGISKQALAQKLMAGLTSVAQTITDNGGSFNFGGEFSEKQLNSVVYKGRYGANEYEYTLQDLMDSFGGVEQTELSAEKARRSTEYGGEQTEQATGVEAEQGKYTKPEPKELRKQENAQATMDKAVSPKKAKSEVVQQYLWQTVTGEARALFRWLADTTSFKTKEGEIETRVGKRGEDSIADEVIEVIKARNGLSRLLRTGAASSLREKGRRPAIVEREVKPFDIIVDGDISKDNADHIVSFTDNTERELGITSGFQEQDGKQHAVIPVVNAESGRANTKALRTGLTNLAARIRNARQTSPIYAVALDVKKGQFSNLSRKHVESAVADTIGNIPGMVVRVYWPDGPATAEERKTPVEALAMQPDATMPMYMRYKDLRGDTMSNNTFDEILFGVRRATTRKYLDKQLSEMLKNGEKPVIRFWRGKEGESDFIDVELVDIKPLNPKKMSETQKAQWSRVEGWHPDKLKEYSGVVYQYHFRPVNNTRNRQLMNQVVEIQEAQLAVLRAERQRMEEKDLDTEAVEKQRDRLEKQIALIRKNIPAPTKLVGSRTGKILEHGKGPTGPVNKDKGKEAPPPPIAVTNAIEEIQKLSKERPEIDRLFSGMVTERASQAELDAIVQHARDYAARAQALQKWLKQHENRQPDGAIQTGYTLQKVGNHWRLMPKIEGGVKVPRTLPAYRQFLRHTNNIARNAQMSIEAFYETVRRAGYEHTTDIDTTKGVHEQEDGEVVELDLHGAIDRAYRRLDKMVFSLDELYGRNPERMPPGTELMATIEGALDRDTNADRPDVLSALLRNAQYKEDVIDVVEMMNRFDDGRAEKMLMGLAPVVDNTDALIVFLFSNELYFLENPFQGRTPMQQAQERGYLNTDGTIDFEMLSDFGRNFIEGYINAPAALQKEGANELLTIAGRLNEQLRMSYEVLKMYQWIKINSEQVGIKYPRSWDKQFDMNFPLRFKADAERGLEPGVARYDLLSQQLTKLRVLADYLTAADELRKAEKEYEPLKHVITKNVMGKQLVDPFTAKRKTLLFNKVTDLTHRKENLMIDAAHEWGMQAEVVRLMADDETALQGVLEDIKNTEEHMEQIEKADFTTPLEAIEIDSNVKQGNPFVRDDNSKNQKALNAKHLAIAKAWLRMLGAGGAKVEVITAKEAAELYRQAGKSTRATIGGTVFPMKDGSYKIFIANSGRSSQMMETLGHEVGHIVEFELFNRAPTETQEAIRNAFKQHLIDEYGSIDGETIPLHTVMSDVFRGRHGFNGYFVRGEGYRSDTMENLTPEKRAYYQAFNEWFADQVSRWLTTSEKPVSVVDHFFKELAELWKRVLTAVGIYDPKFDPNTKVADWLNDMTAKANVAEADLYTSVPDHAPDVTFPIHDLDVANVMYRSLNQEGLSEEQRIELRRKIMSLIEAVGAFEAGKARSIAELDKRLAMSYAHAVNGPEAILEQDDGPMQEESPDIEDIREEQAEFRAENEDFFRKVQAFIKKTLGISTQRNPDARELESMLRAKFKDVSFEKWLKKFHKIDRLALQKELEKADLDPARQKEITKLLRKASQISKRWQKIDAAHTPNMGIVEGKAEKFIWMAMHHQHDPFSDATRTAMYYALTDDHLLTPDEKRIITNAMDRGAVRRQLARLMAGADEQTILDMEHNPMLRAAYAYQFWKAGMLNIKEGMQTDTIFKKIHKFFRDLFGIVSDEANAERLFRYFSRGLVARRSHNADFDFQIKSRLNENYAQKGFTALEQLSEPVRKVVGQLFQPAAEQLRKLDNAAINALLNQMYTGTGSAERDEAMISARINRIGQFMKELNDILREQPEFADMSKAEKVSFGKRLQQVMTNREPAATPLEKRVEKELRQLMKRIFRYARAAGVGMEEVHTDQFWPREFDLTKLIAHREDFIESIVNDADYQEALTEYMRAEERQLERYVRDGKLVDEGKRREIAEKIFEAYAAHSGDAESAADELLREQRDEGDRVSKIGAPVAASAKARVFGWLKEEHVAPYLQDDVIITLTKYLSQMVKRAEFYRRFGVDQDGNAKQGRRSIDEYLADAEALGATPEQLQTAENFVKAVMGTLAVDKINPRFQRVQGWILTIENLALLPLATVTSLIDPMGIGVRGDLRSMTKAMKVGVREIRDSLYRGLSKKERRSAERDFSELIGAIEDDTTIEALGLKYGGYYLTGRAQAVNNWWFHAIGLEAWTQITRTMATTAAKDFIRRHLQNPTEDSERYMSELKITAEDVDLNDENLGAMGSLERARLYDMEDEYLTLLTEKKKAMQDINQRYSDERERARAKARYFQRNDIQAKEARMDELKEGQEERKSKLRRDARLKSAINRFVDEAILRPDAAQRPIWGSDPRWMLVMHLKSFIMSFHERILRRVFQEAYEGNYYPAAMLLSYAPIMVMIGALRAALQGKDDDDDDDWVATLWKGAQASGMFGLFQFGLDAMEDMKRGGSGFGRLAGPAADHLGDIVGAAMPNEGWNREVKALMRTTPGYVAWKDWVS